ncbi:ribosomal protein L28e [Dendrothele bispora CBS 962.96]|uniref:Ribosomal protein L28e n=1 Tax=Dendrothele bispora (strain CBS 962.96) TaxID=1314807 RepID=A0A4V4HCQ7_DENBC|nr:ribosomal protein L28e [Dendrothele bispora CBS 962.96]
MSSDLEWLLLRNYNSFMVKGLPEGPIFSKEPGNLRNLHSHKFSGLANSKTIDISDNNGTLQITTRKVKTSSPHVVKSGKSVSTVRPRSGPRRALGVATATSRRGYRPDLRTSALARTSALLSAQKEPKATPPKKVRGSKKNSA